MDSITINFDESVRIRFNRLPRISIDNTNNTFKIKMKETYKPQRFSCSSIPRSSLVRTNIQGINI